MPKKNEGDPHEVHIPERLRPTSGHLSSDEILIGWSLEERQHRPIGFSSASKTFNREQVRGLDPITHGREGHLMTIAPTGAGKGTGCAIPALLQYSGPVIVVDPKGENYEVTARYRRDSLGHKIVRLDPMEMIRKQSDGLNPFDLIHSGSPDEADDASMIASILLPEHADDRNRWWVRRSRQLVSGLLLHIVSDYPEAERSFTTLRKILNIGTDQYPELVNKLQISSHEDVRDMANMFSNKAMETLGGVISYAQECVEIFRGHVREATEQSTFSLDEITRGDPVSVYLILPPEKLDSHSALLKLWISTFFAAITRRRGPPQSRTLFILDEAAQLGPLPQLRQAITLLRGYGVQTWSFWQDLAQLKYLYPSEWKTMVNNCHVLQAFGIPNLSAAFDMADLIGYSSPAALADLDYDEMLLLRSGNPAEIAQRPNYLSDACFKGLFDPNPKHSNFVDVMPPPKRPQRSFRKEPPPPPPETPAPAQEDLPLWTIPIRNATGEVTSYYKLTGDELSVSVEGSLEQRMLKDWPLLPLLDGDWEELQRPDAIEQLVSLWPNVNQGAAVGVSGIDAVRRMPLDFLDDAWLVEARCLKGEHFFGYLTFLEIAGQHHHLDGSNTTINRLGSMPSFDISTEEKAFQFFMLYCGALSSLEGTFTVVTGIERTFLLSSVSDETLAQVQKALIPNKLTKEDHHEDQGDLWLADVLVKYQRDLFRATFRFSGSQVQMESDDKICQIAESTRLDFDSGIRREWFPGDDEKAKPMQE